MRVVSLLASLLLIAAILGAAVWWALPHLTSKPPAQPKHPHEIVLGLDLSKSNPLITDERFAQKVAQRAGGLIRGLRIRDEVKLRTFGSYDPREQPLHLDQQISTVTQPDDAADVVQGIIAGLPTLIGRGTLIAQNDTNIVAFLDNMAQIVDCKAKDTTIILASDGIEDSALTHLINEKSKLPPPVGKPFLGCTSLQILGLGVGAKNPALTAHLRKEWAAWAKAAGFKSFDGLNDW